MTARAESHHESTWLEAKTQILQALLSPRLRASAVSFCFFRSVLSVFIRTKPVSAQDGIPVLAFPPFEIAKTIHKHLNAKTIHKHLNANTIHKHLNED